MSGGAYEYLCYKMEDAADRLKEEKSPLRRAFGEHLDLCAKAMHDIEWVDSGDSSEGQEVDAVKEVLGDTVAEKSLEIIKQEARNLRDALNRILGETE